MRPGIILASYPVSQHALDLGRRFIRIYETHFPDAVIYIGINSAPLMNEWAEIFQESSLEIYYDITPKNLELCSDASAYQTALRLYKDKSINHDLVWFNHFKSVTHRETYGIADREIDELLLCRSQVEDVFANPLIGFYANKGWRYGHDMPDQVSKYYEFTYPHFRIQPLFTFFVVRGIALQNLVQNGDISLLNEPLPDRYFMENNALQLICRQGYLPHIHNCVRNGDYSGVANVDTTAELQAYLLNYIDSNPGFSYNRETNTNR